MKKMTVLFTAVFMLMSASAWAQQGKKPSKPNLKQLQQQAVADLAHVKQVNRFSQHDVSILLSTLLPKPATAPATRSQVQAAHIQSNPALFLNASEETLKTYEADETLLSACVQAAHVLHLLAEPNSKSAELLVKAEKQRRHNARTELLLEGLSRELQQK